MTKRAKSRSDVQQSVEAEMLTTFGHERGITWCEPADVDGLAELGIKLDGVAVLADGTIVIAEAWAHQGAANGSQPHKVAGDVLKLSYAASFLRGKGKKVEAFMLFACSDAARVLTNSGWRGSAAKHFGVAPVVVTINHATRGSILKAQLDQNFYRAEPSAGSRP